ncbi:unnamed protein product [Knipowitschia caucasica]|uniref:High mobility group nucleosome-binding domain-containing protein 3 n=1 Tax=Knipowitschia caucasica TaxID=637954 RepID=A0AAV2KCH3_KNICA
MPKRKSEGPEGKEAPKVTKQEAVRRSERLAKLAPPKTEMKTEMKPKKTVLKVVKKSGVRGRKDDDFAHNGDAKESEAAEEATDEKA